MKVLHVPYSYYPDPVGGTEVYVAALACEQLKDGVKVVVAAPGSSQEEYEHEGVRVIRFAPGEIQDLRELYGEGSDEAARSLSAILKRECPDVLHLHSSTSAVSLKSVMASKAAGIPVVFTYHTPTISCQRGTLLRWGSEVCDGTVIVDRCAACTLNSLGLSRVPSKLVGLIPPALSALVGRLGLSGGAWTALRLPELTDLRRRAFLQMAAQVDRIVVLCEWARSLLIQNSISEHKISLCRHGINIPVSSQTDRATYRSNRPVRIAFLGRYDRAKGADVLVRAVKQIPKVPLELHLYGIIQGEAGQSYLQELQKLSGDDSRICFESTLPGSMVIPVLRTLDFVAVPSQCLETGPLVVLEAFAAGTPVLGSDLGGIRELVQHQQNGLLVPFDSVKAWSEALGKCTEDRTLLSRLREGIRSPRSIRDVAKDMRQVYEDVIQTPDSSPKERSELAVAYARR